MSSESTVSSPFIEDYLAYLLAHASFVVGNGFYRRLQKHHIAIAEWRVLAVLNDSDGLSVGQLAAATLLKQPTLTKVLDRMLEKGWAQRRDAQQDRRVVQVYITQHGREMIGPWIERARSYEQEVLSDYSQDEQRLLKQALRQLIVRCRSSED